MSTEFSGRSYRAVAVAAVIVITVVGAIPRFRTLGTPGLWLDEILAVKHAETIPLLARGIGPDPGDGPVYHGLLKITLGWTSDEGALRAAFATAGTLSIPLLAALAYGIGGAPAAVLAAALLAASPIHIFYSREARPYTLLLLQFTLGLLAIVRLGRRPASQSADHVARTIRDDEGARWRYVLYASLLSLVLTAAHSSFYCAVLVAAALCVSPSLPGRRLRWALELVGVIGICLVIFFALYGTYLDADRDTAGPPAPTWDVFARLLQALVSGHSESQPATHLVPGSLLIIAIGGIYGVYVGRLRGAAIVASAVGGFVVPLGALYFVGHWINARYVLLALPGLLVLLAVAGAGASAAIGFLVAAIVPRLRVAAAIGAALLMSAGVVAAQVRPIATARNGKADWRYIAQLIKERARAGDLVIGSNGWADVCLSYYLPRIGASVDLRSADESIERAHSWLGAGTPAFLVAGGFHRDYSIREWIEEFYLLYSSRVEAIRVAFHPDRVAYLRFRATEEEQRQYSRVLWSDLSGQMVVAPDPMPFLLDGWGNLETDVEGRQYRWAEGGRSRLYVPVVDRAPARLQLDVTRFAPLPAQSLTVLVDGTHVADIALPRENSFQDLDLSRLTWTPGGHIVELVFSAAARPSDTMPGSADTRALTALFRSIRVR